MTLEKLATSRLLSSPKLGGRVRVITIQGLSPDGKNTWDFQITPENAKHFTERSKGAVLELGKNVPFVLSEKNALVFQGLRSDGHLEGLCYVGCPHRRYREDGTEFSPKIDESFLVYVCEARMIYTSRWEAISAKSLENEFQHRFIRRIR